MNWSTEQLYHSEDILAWALEQPIPTNTACNPTVINAPSLGNWSIDLKIYATGFWRKLIATNIVTQEQWYNIYNVSDWTGWKQTATATPPTEYNLPLASGVAYPARYNKDQFGTVHISARIKTGVTNSASNWIVVATLPAGYRPPATTAFAVAVGTDINFQSLAGCGSINTDGTVCVLSQSQWTDVDLAVSFVSAP